MRLTVLSSKFCLSGFSIHQLMISIGLDYYFLPYYGRSVTIMEGVTNCEYFGNEVKDHFFQV